MAAKWNLTGEANSKFLKEPDNTLHLVGGHTRAHAHTLALLNAAPCTAKRAVRNGFPDVSADSNSRRVWIRAAAGPPSPGDGRRPRALAAARPSHSQGGSSVNCRDQSRAKAGPKPGQRRTERPHQMRALGFGNPNGVLAIRHPVGVGVERRAGAPSRWAVPPAAAVPPTCRTSAGSVRKTNVFHGACKEEELAWNTFVELLAWQGKCKVPQNERAERGTG